MLGHLDQSIGFYREKRKLVAELSSNIHLIHFIWKFSAIVSFSRHFTFVRFLNSKITVTWFVSFIRTIGIRALENFL